MYDHTYMINEYKTTEKRRIAARKAQKKFRDERPEAADAIGVRYRQSRREFVNSLKDKPCLDCGNKFPPECMDFDHVRGKKTLGIYQMYTRKMELLLDEISKCDLVCSNCHRIRTCARKPPKWEKESTE